MLSDSLNWNLVQIVDNSPTGQVKWGSKANGTWTGLLSHLINGTADTICTTYQYTTVRSQDFDFSYPLTNVQPFFVARAKNETINSVLWNAFKPFSWAVWGTLFASLIFNIFVMIFISKIECMIALRQKFQPFEMIWNIVQLQLNEKSDAFIFFTISAFVAALRQFVAALRHRNTCAGVAPISATVHATVASFVATPAHVLQQKNAAALRQIAAALRQMLPQLRFFSRETLSKIVDRKLFSGNIVLFLFALLQSGLMVDLYKGLLLTSLLTSNRATPFQNSDEMIQLIAENKYHIVTDWLSWYYDDLEHSNVSHFVKLRAAVKNNPVVQVRSVDEALDLVDTGKYVYPMQQDTLSFHMSKERCGYIYIGQGMPQVFSYFLFPKNSSYISEFNQHIIKNYEFIQRTINKYFISGYELGKGSCGSDSEDSHEYSNNLDSKIKNSVSQKPLDLESVIGVFMIGALGIGISFIAFFTEIYHYWHMRILERHIRLKNHINVPHLVKIAQFHLSSKENHKNIDVMKLVDVLPKKQI
ncbi:unnamed protein product [Caenorhabditis angaria]|uniref:Solute-binding protein family 3/N-terminal domain-containing protein n=1 Tax=Caenorhabditis angaria TaxID=860376 RepID=A0A9P1IYU6_9PELO|nr:unnamed protein product [Caenorhabditis angaria]